MPLHSRKILLALLVCATAQAARPGLQVSPSPALLDSPLSVRATGLAPGTVAEIVATTRSKGVTWRSAATCRADSSGTIDLAKCDSSGGTYTGIDAGGLQWSMVPSSESSDFYEPPPAGRPIEYTVDLVVGGKAVATATATRLRSGTGIVTRSVTQPFVGTLALPASSGRHAAVILLGGSEGGDSLGDVAPLLASHDIVALSVAYFGVPGTPKHLVDVPIETVGTALAWLSKQPSVDPSRIGALGISKGGELALLAGSTYPQIRRVVSVVGAPFAMYGIDVGSPRPNARGSWSKAGVELPFVPADPAAAAKVHSQIASGGKVSLGLEADASVANDPAAVRRAFFPLERISGPVLCVGAGDDHVWNSARNCEVGLTYLRAHRHPFSDRNLLFDAAGHDVLTFYYPSFGVQEFNVGRFTEVDGGSAQADGRANEVAWPAIVDFLLNGGSG